jgi:hypothetical protein
MTWGGIVPRRIGLLATTALCCGTLALTIAGTVAASPTVKSANLVKNGAAELGQAASNSGEVFAPQGWTTTGEFTQLRYGASGGFPDATISKTIQGGKAFFAGGNAAESTATQTASVPSGWLKWVRRSRVKAVLSADLGGYGGQEDAATVVAHFMDSGGLELGSMQIGPVTPTVRGGQTKLLLRTKTLLAPAQTVSITIVITCTRDEGAYNDAYVDNVKLTLRR